MNALEEATFDVAIVGGGVNGCGTARDAAGRGASVILFEQNDLASGTSFASTKLIHGGLRYLEHYEFRLVREALMEREVLWWRSKLGLRLSEAQVEALDSCMRNTATSDAA